MTFYSPKHYKEIRKATSIDKPLYQENRLDEEIIRTAKNDWELDMLNSIKEGYSNWLKKGNKGSTIDYLNSLSLDELKRISLKEGGYVPPKNKPKEPTSVKKIDLMDEFLKTADMYSKLSSEEIKTLNWMHKKLFPKD